MKVTIRGNNPVTGDQVKQIIDDLNEEYSSHGLKVKNMTCYIRFINEAGETVEPLDQYGDTMDRTITINKVKKIPAAEKDTAVDKPKKKSKKKPTVFDIDEL